MRETPTLPRLWESLITSSSPLITIGTYQSHHDGIERGHAAQPAAEKAITVSRFSSESIAIRRVVDLSNEAGEVTDADNLRARAGRKMQSNLVGFATTLRK